MTLFGSRFIETGSNPIEISRSIIDIHFLLYIFLIENIIKRIKKILSRSLLNFFLKKLKVLFIEFPK